MTDVSQIRALKNYRKRLIQRGMIRFEVLGLNADRELIRLLAKKLSESGPDASRIRTAMQCTLSEESAKGGIFRKLRESPLVGADLELTRSKARDRKADL